MSDDRKTVFLGMPTYGSLTERAAAGMFNATAGALNVNRLLRGSSLLALNMNHLWCWALNAARRGERVDYFAMQHSDIEPLGNWLDVLVAELEGRGLDVLGVVAPIKDQQGLTSIALAHPDGDPMHVRARLTMQEVFRLPETFTSADVGAPLLINTGLWVARWGDWCRQLHFTINDEIVFDERAGEYVPRVEPEDWFVSRAFHALGLKVGCTRKVELGHRGQAVFGNHQPWGEMAFDRHHVAASPLDGLRPADWFPDGVEGWLTQREGRKLALLAAGKRVLEIGSFCGRSTICLAQKAARVTCVDPFDGRATPVPGPTLEKFIGNVRAAGVADRLGVLVGTTADFAPDGLGGPFDLAFIDGAHDYESVRADIAAALAVLAPGGLLAFHDYRLFAGEADGRWDEGVTRAVNELISAGGALLSRHDSLAVIRPPAGVPSEV